MRRAKAIAAASGALEKLAQDCQPAAGAPTGRDTVQTTRLRLAEDKGGPDFSNRTFGAAAMSGEQGWNFGQCLPLAKIHRVQSAAARKSSAATGPLGSVFKHHGLKLSRLHA